MRVLVLLALVGFQNVLGDTAPLSESVLPTQEQGRKNDEKPVISLEYKPIKPFYQSSGSNVAQIVPPGQPWPASAAGYANFSQLSPGIITKYEGDDDVPLLQSAPTPNSANVLNLDMSNPNTNFAEALEKLLAPELANVNITDEQQTISISINIVPPSNATIDFVRAFQASVRAAISKLIPFAGTSLKITITKSSSGAIVNVKALLTVIVPAAVKKIVLPPSNVPEIDLTESSSGLVKNLRGILLKELSIAGYNPDSTSTQTFPLSFSILPPEGSTKDYVKLKILRPLQAVLKGIAPNAAITSISVNTQESNQEILRQIVKINVKVVPSDDLQVSNNVVEVPEVNLDVPGTNMVTVVVTTLQDQIKKIAANSAQGQTVSVPFKITPAADVTQQQIQEEYIVPISGALSKLDPTGNILKIRQKTLPNGDIVIVVYINVPANTTLTTSSNGQIQTVPVVPKTTTVPVETSTVKINNRNAIPEGQEDEVPTPEGTTESKTPNIQKDAIRTSVVDLTTPTASLDDIKQILDDQLSPASNPVDDGSSKILAIPFRMKPPEGTSIQDIHENVVVPIEKLLVKLEPTGEVIASKTKPSSDGQVEAIVYFDIPSVKGSRTYKDLSATTETPTTPQVPEVGIPKNSVKTTPIDLSHPNFDVLKNGIQERLNDLPKTNEPQTVGFPFVVPKDQAKRIPVMAQAIATLIKGLVPSGKAVATVTPKVLPNGDVEFTIYYEIPAISDNKPGGGVVEDKKEPDVVSKDQEAIGSSTVAPKTSKVINDEVQPENVVLTPPIDTKNLDRKNIIEDIKQRIDDVSKTNNGQAQMIGVPFIMPKKSYFMEVALKKSLELLNPGKVLPETKTRNLPNGDVEYIVFYEKPEVTKGKPTEKPEEEPTKPTVENKNEATVKPETGTPQVQDEEQPENTVLTPPIDMKNLDQKRIVNDIRQRIDEMSKTNNGQAKIIGIPFIMPKKMFLMEKALKKTLEMLNPGKVLPEIKTRNLPNGDVEYVVFYEKPEVTNEKPTEKPGEEQTKPTVENKNEATIKPETETPQVRDEEQPKNSVLTPPIDIKKPDFETIVDDIRQRIDDLSKTDNGQSKIIGLPFIMPKKNYFMELALKNALEMILPGKVLPETKTRNLPDGKVEYTIYYEKPEVTNEKPTEKPEQEPTKPSVENKNEATVKPGTETPQVQDDEQPKNSVLTPPIDIKKPDFQTIVDDIRQRIDDLSKTDNGQSKIIGLPFIMPKKNYFMELALKKSLEMILPGKVLPETKTRNLPDGKVEYTIYYEKPEVTNEKHTEKPEEEPTKPSVENKNEATVKPGTETPQVQDEEQPKNSVLTPPIDIKKPDFQTIVDDIRRRIDELSKTDNGQSKIIGLPFIMPKKNYFMELALKKSLEMVLPGKVLPETKTRNLPDGKVEYTIYYEKPEVTNEKPTEKPEEEQTKPSVENKNEATVKPVTETKSNDEGVEEPKTPSVENDDQNSHEDLVVQPETTPINLQPFNIETIKDKIEQRVNKLIKDNDGKAKLVDLPFVLPKNLNSPLVKMSLVSLLKVILPGKILPEPQSKVLPNGDTEIVFQYELPEVNKNVQETLPEAVVDVNLDEPGASIVGEVSKALIKGISTISTDPENLNKLASLKFNIYTPLDNTLPQNEQIINDVSSELKNLEPDSTIISAKVDPNHQKNEPDGVVVIKVPSVASSKTALTLKNAIELPPIDTNVPGLKLVDTIKVLLQKGLKSVGPLNPKGSQLFDLRFRLNPFNTKASVYLVKKALKAVDPKGVIVSDKISSGPDGLDYLEVRYLIPKLEDSVIYEVVKPEEPEVVYESVVVIDTLDPLNGLLNKVISAVGAAQDQVKGVAKEELVNLPLNFKFTNSRGLSDSEVSEVVSRTLPYIKNYIGQVLPDGKILLVHTEDLPNSDDVILKIVVRTPFEPDNTIVIEEQRPRFRHVATPKPKSGGILGIFD